MTSRTATHASQLNASLRAAGRKARHTARTHTRWTAGIAATAAVGAIAAVAVAAPWAGASSSLPGGGLAASGNHAAASLELAAGHQASTAQPATAAQSAATHQASKAAAAKAAAKQAAAKKAAAAKAASSSKPSTIYDSVTPTAIPSGQKVATYSDGPYQASSSSVSGHGKVLWIDVNGSNTSADALDVEPGDATPAGAAQWVSAKLTKDPSSTAIVYTFKSDWSSVISDVNALPSWMHSHVKYWIADPTGTPHILPGAAATQWYWGTSYDITAAAPGFFS